MTTFSWATFISIASKCLSKRANEFFFMILCSFFSVLRNIFMSIFVSTFSESKCIIITFKMLLHTLGRLSTTVNTQGRRIAARCFSSAVNFYEYLNYNLSLIMIVLAMTCLFLVEDLEAEHVQLKQRNTVFWTPYKSLLFHLILSNIDAKVGLFDYVDPSTRGTTWGLGGTCVNVGCIPKKIFHYASRLKEAQEDMRNLGFEVHTIHAWSRSIVARNDSIRLEYISWLRTKLHSRIEFRSQEGHENECHWVWFILCLWLASYFNERASFIDDHTIQGEDKNGKKRIVTAEKIVIATGGRPSILYGLFLVRIKT